MHSGFLPPSGSIYQHAGGASRPQQLCRSRRDASVTASRRRPELAPELIELDDWGYPIVRQALVPPKLATHAARAVEACPVLAFRLFEDPALASKVTPAPGKGRPQGSNG